MPAPTPSEFGCCKAAAAAAMVATAATAAATSSCALRVSARPGVVYASSSAVAVDAGVAAWALLCFDLFLW